MNLDDDKLIDLLYGDLPDAEDDALREALSSDDREALELLEQAQELADLLPMEEPPAGMDAVIMAAAAAAAARHASDAVPLSEKVPSENVPSDPRATEAAPERNREDNVVPLRAAEPVMAADEKHDRPATLFPMIALAAGVLLAFGAYWFSRETMSEATVAMETAPTEAEIDALAPSLPQATEPPAAPAPEGAAGAAGLDGYEREAIEAETFAEQRQDLGGLQAAAMRRRSRSSARPRSGGGPVSQAPDLLAPEDEAADIAQPPARARSVASVTPMAASARPDLSNAGVPLPGGTIDGLTENAYGRGSASGGSASSGPSLPVARAEAAPARAQEQQVPSMLSAAMGEQEAARYAFQMSSPAEDPIAASALHQLGRSQRRAGDCRAAVSTFQDLRRRFPSYTQLGSALIDQARCQRSLGQLRAAVQTLEVAEQTPSVRVRARAERTQIETLLRTQRRARRRAMPAEAYDSVEASPAY